MRLHPRENTKHPRRAASSTGIALTLLVVCALVVGIVLLVERTHAPRAATAGVEGMQTATSEHATPLTSTDPNERTPKAPIPSYDPTKIGPERFEGRGRVRGEVSAVDGAAFPTAWSLVFEPHPYLIGKERAVAKRVEFTAGERTFDVPDLQLGGYRVRVEAPDLNGSEVSALLVRGSATVYATLEFHPSGFVDGRILAATGAPADGIDVVIEEKTTQIRTNVHADANGQFVFHGIKDGEYILYVGAPESPLIPPRSLAFKAPTMRVPDMTLPPTGALTIHTNNQNGTPLGEVSLAGFGTPTGSLRAVSGPNALVRVPWLAPGSYNIEGTSLDGRRGKVIADVRADTETDAVLNLAD